MNIKERVKRLEENMDKIVDWVEGLKNDVPSTNSELDKELESVKGKMSETELNQRRMVAMDGGNPYDISLKDVPNTQDAPKGCGKQQWNGSVARCGIENLANPLRILCDECREDRQNEVCERCGYKRKNHHQDGEECPPFDNGEKFTLQDRQDAPKIELMKSLNQSKTESMEGGLWFTTMGRIVLDDHNNEVFAKGYDKKLMTKEELTKGVFLDDFMKRITGLIDVNQDKGDKQ